MTVVTDEAGDVVVVGASDESITVEETVDVMVVSIDEVTTAVSTVVGKAVVVSLDPISLLWSSRPCSLSMGAPVVVAGASSEVGVEVGSSGGGRVVGTSVGGGMVVVGAGSVGTSGSTGTEYATMDLLML